MAALVQVRQKLRQATLIGRILTEQSFSFLQSNFNQWPAMGFAPQVSNLQALSLQCTQWIKNDIIDAYEILVQK